MSKLFKSKKKVFKVASLHICTVSFFFEFNVKSYKMSKVLVQQLKLLLLVKLFNL